MPESNRDLACPNIECPTFGCISSSPHSNPPHCRTGLYTDGRRSRLGDARVTGTQDRKEDAVARKLFIACFIVNIVLAIGLILMATRYGL